MSSLKLAMYRKAPGARSCCRGPYLPLVTVLTGACYSMEAGVLTVLRWRIRTAAGSTRLARMLADALAVTMGVERRCRLSCFGVERLEVAPAAHGRQVLIAERDETAGDLVRDMVDMLHRLLRVVARPTRGPQPVLHVLTAAERSA